MATTLEPVAAAVSCGAERSASAAPAGARPALRPRKACLRCSYERNCTDPCETCGEPTRLRRGARDGEHETGSTGAASLASLPREHESYSCSGCGLKTCRLCRGVCVRRI